MKKLIAITLTSLLSSATYTMEKVTLPTAKILQERLVAAGMPLMAVQKLNIATDLGEKTIDPSTLQPNLETTFKKYTDTLTNPVQLQHMTLHIKQHMPEVIAAILQDHPTVIENLKTTKL